MTPDEAIEVVRDRARARGINLTRSVLRSLLSGIVHEPDATTLQNLRAENFAARLSRGGATCPVCDQHSQVYRRTITTTMARGLIFLYHNTTVGEPAKLTTLTTDERLAATLRGDFPKFRFWGFVERRELEGDDETKKHSNVYAITAAGAEFVRGECFAPRYKWTYLDRVVASSEDMTEEEMIHAAVTPEECRDISVADALGEHFHYGALMAAAGAWIPE